MPILQCVLPALAASLLATAASAEMIHLMARKGDVAKVIAEIDKGVPVDLPSTIHTTLAGASPLFVAARFGRTDVVAALLEAGADPNYRRPDSTGEAKYGAPLHAATESGHKDVVRLLLEAGADPSLRDPELGVPLHLARLRGHHAIADLLIAEGVAVTIDAESIAPMIAGADLENGRVIAVGCGICHHIAREAAEPKVGPELWNLLGRDVASLETYSYSQAMAAHGGKWTYETLNDFLSAPRDYLPGTKMEIRGFPDPKTRADLIAYLRLQSDTPVPLP